MTKINRVLMKENTVLTKVKRISKCGSVMKCQITILMYVCLNSGGVAFETFLPALPKKFDICENLPKNCPHTILLYPSSSSKSHSTFMYNCTHKLIKIPDYILIVYIIHLF